VSMEHGFLDNDLRDRAALFVLESMPEHESRVFRLHLRRCDVCRHEVDSLARAASDLVWLAPEEAPRPEVWGRVLERIRGEDPRTGPDRPQSNAVPDDRGELPDTLDTPDSPGASAPAGMADVEGTQIWKGWATLEAARERDAFTFLAAGEGRFEPTSMPGVEARRLSIDAERDRVTMLVRMAPGTSWPAHVHGGPEECLVISGDLRIGALHMRGGDFQRAEPGSTHVVQSTDEGCVLLITSSLHDEIL
jgi:quercetin dioxygenase-like cupin family protein